MSELTVGAGETWQFKGAEVTVAPACAGTAGHWVCLTCSEAFPHNLAAAGHTNRPGEHPMAWWCHEHGTAEAAQ